MKTTNLVSVLISICGIGLVPVAEAGQPSVTALNLISVGPSQNSPANSTAEGNVETHVRDGLTNYYVAGDYRGVVATGAFSATNNNPSVALFVARQNPAGQMLWLRTSDPGLTFQRLAPHPAAGTTALALFHGPMTNHFAGATLTSTSTWGALVLRLDADGSFQGSAQISATGTNVTIGATQVPIAPFAIVQAQYDSLGNLIVAGNFQERLNVAGIDLASPNSPKDINYFVAKIGSNGVAQWAVQGGSTWVDDLFDAAVDSAGNVFLTVAFGGGTNVLGANSWSAPAGDGDGLLLKFNSDGSFAWGKQASLTVNGFSRDFESVRPDGFGGCYSVGRWCNVNQDMDMQIFAARYDASGNQMWIQPFSKTNNINYYIRMIGYPKIDAAGNLYIAGEASTPFAMGNLLFTNAGGVDVFVAKLDGNGVPQWIQPIATSGDESLAGFGVDQAGNCFVLGLFTSSLTFGTNSVSSRGIGDSFLAKLDTAGNPQWILPIGSTESDFANDVLPDENGGVFLNGFFSGLNYIRNVPLSAAASMQSFIANVADATTNNPPSVALNPTSQTVMKGTNLTLSTSALGTEPLFFQWFKDGIPIPNATSPVLQLSGVMRTNSAHYSLAISNAFGTNWSSDAIVRIQAQQRLGRPVAIGNGYIQFTFGDQDGEAIRSDDLPYLEVQGTTSSLPNGWMPLPAEYQVLNGLVQFTDTNAPTYPQRFYRVLQK